MTMMTTTTTTTPAATVQPLGQHIANYFVIIFIAHDKQLKHSPVAGADVIPVGVAVSATVVAGGVVGGGISVHSVALFVALQV